MSALSTSTSRVLNVRSASRKPVSRGSPYHPCCALASEDRGDAQARDREERRTDQDSDAPPGDAGGLFAPIDVFGADRDAGIQTGNATNVAVTSEAKAAVIEADASEAVTQAAVIEAASRRSKHPEG